MSVLSTFNVGEPLMKWREPNAYSRQDISQPRGWIGLAFVVLVPILLLLISPYFDRDKLSPRAMYILVSFFVVLGAAIFVRTWFGPGNVVCLNEDHLSRATSRPVRRTRYRDIESCSVSHDSYDGIKFSILTFALRKGLPVGQVTQIVLPDDSSLDRALQILRDKGIKIVEKTQCAV